MTEIWAEEDCYHMTSPVLDLSFMQIKPSNQNIDSCSIPSKVNLVKEGKNWILKGENCDDLNKNIFAMTELYFRLKFEKDLIGPEIHELYNQYKINCEKKSEANGYQFNLNDIMPRKIAEVLFTTPLQAGPNCWNSVLAAQNILLHWKTAEAEEMNYMAKHDCHEKPLVEPLQPGDTILIRSKRDFDEDLMGLLNVGFRIPITDLESKSLTKEELGGPEAERHAFLYITEQLSFTKNGSSEKEAYQMMPSEDIFALYSVPKECIRVLGVPKNPACEKRYANVFRCHPNVISEYSFDDQDIEKLQYATEDLKLKLMDIPRMEKILSVSALRGAPGDVNAQYRSATVWDFQFEVKKLIPLLMETKKSVEMHLAQNPKITYKDKVKLEATLIKVKSLIRQGQLHDMLKDK